MKRRCTWGIVLWGVSACGPSASNGVTAETTGTSTGPAIEESSGTTVVVTGSGDSADTTAATTMGSGDSSEGSTTARTTGEVVCVPQCPGAFDCNDGVDNDGDGLVDTEDPECVSPCHNDEDTTYHGLPIGGGDCTADCYFDQDVGMGNDGCVWEVTCDPLGPGDRLQCFADPDDPACNNLPEHPRCPVLCEPLTPPGCDCYGCCTFPARSGGEDRWLEHPDCTLDDPESCPLCTKQVGCANPCDDPCEWCFGEPQPPADCSEVTCEHGAPCVEHCDCADGMACLQGCCRPGMIE